MAETIVTDDIELIHSGGGGSAPPARNDGGDGDPFGNGATPQRTYVTGMMLGLGGILMFFMALVSAYIVRKGLPNNAWIPLQVPRILWLNTLVLIGSSFSLVHARKLYLAGKTHQFRRWWGVTTILGLSFLAGQILAWRELVHEGVYLSTNPSSSFFYVFTAAHGLHLLGGVIALLLVAVRPTRKLTRGTATEVVSMYWHFMDGLWVFLFLLFLVGQ
ncbi:MAG TPA: cytochrome c oxidase subunit 3 [Candidatus Acidoferrum sp.]|nr:cytochrome c oxidase subunit 3 [Candidatus Acidoferrum sp.]